MKGDCMISNKKQGNLIIISGISGAGKGSVIKKILEINPNIHLSISYTSRPMRPGDIDGVTYKFVTKEEFEEKIAKGELLEYTIYSGNYYGTPKLEVRELLNQGHDVLLEIEVEGASKVKEMFPETILIFILPPSMEEVKRRLKARNSETKEQIIKRFQTAYQEINEIYKYNYVVVNDNLEEAVKKVNAIMVSEKCRVDRIEELSVENQEEFMHELLMDKEFDNDKKLDF